MLKVEEIIMGEQIAVIILVRMVLITGGVLLFLFAGEPDIHNAIIELLRSWAN